MKCPFRLNEIHDVRGNGVTKVNMEFGEYHKNDCPYWGVVEYSPYGEVNGCRKVNKEVR